MTAIFRINQPGITGGKPVTGNWDEARADLDLVGVGGSVVLEAQDAMNSYSWQIVSEPEGSSIVLGTPNAPTASMDVPVTGGYLVRLTVDEGLPTKDISELYVGVPLVNSSLPIPALNETVQDNRIPSAPGYERKMTAWMKWVDANAGSGSEGGVYEEPAGPTLSTRRVDSGATILGDYSFSSGSVNNIDVASSYCFVYGGGEDPGEANSLVGSVHTAVIGHRNTLTGTYCAFVLGRDNSLQGNGVILGGGNAVWGGDALCIGSANVIGTAVDIRTGTAVVGDSNTINASRVVALGFEHLSEAVGQDSTLLGRYVRAKWPASLYHSLNPYLDYGAGQIVLCTHLSKVTTDETWGLMTIVTTGGVSNELVMEDQTIYLGELKLIARTADGASDPSELKTWVVRFTAHRDQDGNVTMFPIDKTVIAMTSAVDEASWDVDVAINPLAVGTPIEIRVKGESMATVRWYGVLQTVEYHDQNLGGG